MDQHKQNALLSNLSTNNFQSSLNGIPHCSTSSLMSTLQSLQMQSIGNPMIPSNDLQCDLPNQLLFEQIQLRAMQSVYNNFGQKIDSKLPPQPHRNSQGSISLPFNGLSQRKLADSQQSSGDNQKPSNSCNNYAMGISSTEPSICVPSTSFLPPTLSVAQSSFSTSNLLNSMNGDKITLSSLPEKSSLINPTSSSASISAEASYSSFPVQSSYNGKNGSESSVKEHNVEPSSVRNRDPYKLDYDEAHDDVDNIFGLSLAENDTRTDSLFRMDDNRGLSPINFTPPDSPHEELTLDMLFGLPATSKEDKTSEEAPLKRFEESTDVGNTESISVTEKAEKNDASDIIQNYSKSNKIPVYKQKAVLMSIEARTAARKDDPNYDAFEFDEDDDLMDGPATETKLEAPVKQETRWKNVYVPKQGFLSANHDEKDQNLVCSKKQSGRCITDYNDLIADKTFFTHADTLRERKDKRMTCSFLEPSQRTDTECSKNMRRLKPDEPLLPKLMIRVQQVQQNTEDVPQKKKRSKKRSSSNDEDSDWDDRIVRRRKIVKKIYSVHEVSADRMPSASTSNNVLALQIYDDPQFCEFVRKRLTMFGSAEGTLPKGTYVVCKMDVLKEDCALWRVDNQNLLQKFPPFREFQTNRQVYRSSSTYSGWCEQISSQYFRVAVKVLKQNRSETTIEPEIPLHDLFPAMSAEMFKNPRTVHIKEEQKLPNEEEFDKMLRVSLTTMIEAFLTQCVTTNHIETLVEKNDYAFTRSLGEIEKANLKAEDQIRHRIRVGKKHSRWIEEYTKVAISRNSFNSMTKCQICKIKRPRRVIHFFHRGSYNENNFIFDVNKEADENAETIRTATDAISCGRCATAVQYLHQMRHIKLHLALACEEKLEEIGTEEIDHSPETNIESAKSDKLWVLGLIQKYCIMWETIDLQFRKV